MNNLKRFTVCLVGHKWVKVAYPVGADGKAAGYLPALPTMRQGRS